MKIYNFNSSDQRMVAKLTKKFPKHSSFYTVKNNSISINTKQGFNTIRKIVS